ncbi:DUF5994 family protein [Lentzea cavernae]|uniref:Uncharacterized protein n=1 Tax=Lentzea cavernae TaxID=2020703 RepID=A0ABQ3MHE1_9PSEU|nr:DUF5994 family protein [Lentzea cavernae]GHH42523.1 hypothetical protein GCM10017774_39030 [Lentzea cavernae]
MTSAPHQSIAPPVATADEQPRHQPRLRLEPKALSTGYVDGAWWPRSRDLAAELPALLAVLAVRLGEIPRVSYNLTEWDTAPRQIAADGVRVRLSGFWSRPAHTVDLVAGDRRRLTLLVVPPGTEASAAHRTMMRAARRGNSDTVEQLFHEGAHGSDESTVDSTETGDGRVPGQRAGEAR